MNEIDRIAERVLVVKCQMSDRRALEELYLRHSRRVGYYLRRLLENDDVAADVQQEVWLTVIRQISRLKHPEAFVIWLYRIARSRALDRIHDVQQVGELTHEVAEELSDTRTEEANESFSPADAAVIHDALSELTPPHREVLVLRFMEELSYEQIAKIVGCSVGTVRSRLFYAKRVLRSELEKHHDTERNVASR